MLYRDCLKEFLAEQSTSLICEQPPRILPSYRKGQWTLPSKIDRQTLFEQQPGVISGTGGPAKQRRWWASGDRSVDRAVRERTTAELSVWVRTIDLLKQAVAPTVDDPAFFHNFALIFWTVTFVLQSLSCSVFLFWASFAISFRLVLLL